jgi:hypothetical protein
MVVLFSFILDVVGRLLVGVVAGGSLHWCDELSARIKPPFFSFHFFWCLVNVEVASVRLLVRRLSLSVAVPVDCGTDLDVHTKVGLSSQQRGLCWPLASLQNAEAPSPISTSSATGTRPV